MAPACDDLPHYAASLCPAYRLRKQADPVDRLLAMQAHKPQRMVGLDRPVVVRQGENAWAVPQGGSDDRYSCRVHIRFGVEDGALVVDDVRYERRPGDRPITPGTIKRIPLGKVIEGLASSWERAAVDLTVGEANTAGQVLVRPADASGLLRHIRSGRRTKRKIDDRFLRRVAKAYNAALASGRHDPTRAVADALFDDLQRRTRTPGQPPKTAQRWVFLARRRGFLAATAPRRKGSLQTDMTLNQLE
jgi:hypothetical protein